MKVCIYGAGAICGHIGVLLKNAGVDISMIARGAHLEAIRRNGRKRINGAASVGANRTSMLQDLEKGPVRARCAVERRAGVGSAGGGRYAG